MGKLIVIEGIDGSGKSTQYKKLRERLESEGKNFRTLVFPRYDNPSSSLIRMYLGGEFGSDPGDVNAFAASTFYSVDRYASYKTDWEAYYKEGGVLLSDRYTTSNAVHQGAKMPENEREAYFAWLEEFEFGRLQLPRPDMVIFLSVPPTISQKLIEGRYQGDNEKKDIHEADLGYLERCYAGAGYVADRQGWQMLDCAPEGAMLSVEEISDKIWEMVQAIL